MNEQKYIGTALQKPVAIDNGSMVVIGGIEVVQNSIMDILMTPIGTRFMLREYGSRIQECTFEQNDIVLKTLIRHFVRESIYLWEKRAKFEDITFEFEDDIIRCKVYVVIIATNRIESFVFPFYRQLKH